jgi:hypothetical protein
MSSDLCLYLFGGNGGRCMCILYLLSSDVLLFGRRRMDGSLDCVLLNGTYWAIEST